MLVFRQCPLDISPIDCYLALDFFGFPALDIDIKIKEEDPSRMRKMTSFSIFQKTQKAIPLLIKGVKTVVEQTSSGVVGWSGMGSKGAHFVVGPTFHTGSILGPSDLLLHHYKITAGPGSCALFSCASTSHSSFISNHLFFRCPMPSAQDGKRWPGYNISPPRRGDKLPISSMFLWHHPT